jgi:folate-binding protein YgfZ
MENQRTPKLRESRTAGEAVYTRPAGCSVPPVQPEDLAAGYAALCEAAALVDLSGRTVLRLSGAKAVELLNSVLTNEVPEGDRLGAYALLLNPKGRIQTDLRVLKDDRDVLIDVEPEGAAAAKELLGRYAPFYRVELEDLSETDAPWSVLGLYGPGAGNLFDGPVLAEHETAGVGLGGTDLLVVGVSAPVPGYDLLGPADALGAAREHLSARGAVYAGPGAYEIARIEAGVPRFGSDITPENFPAEVGILDRAVSFEKGCYPGQETVARMRYRGHPNRLLRRLVVAGGPSPEPGTPIVQNSKQVGSITSVAPLPVAGKILALGYLSRNADAQDELRAGDAMLGLLP